MTINLNKITQITLALVIVFGLANLVLTNVLATGGHELENIYQQQTLFEKDNFYLKNKIASASSIAYLESKAQSLGFVQINQTLAITTPAPVAYVAQ